MTLPFNINSIRRRSPSTVRLPCVKETEQTLLVSQLLWAKQIQLLLDQSLIDPHHSIPTSHPINRSVRFHVKTPSPFLSSYKDRWGFGDFFWNSICKDYPTEKLLYAAIRNRREDILKVKEIWRKRIEQNKKNNSFYQNLSKLLIEETPFGTYRIPSEFFELSHQGISGTYFLKDAQNQSRFVIKPIDEDIGCLNNGKGFATPYTSSKIRDNMPLYLSSMRETLAYEIACQCKLQNTVPRTVLAIIESSAFHDQLDNVSPEERDRYEKIVGNRVQEKLCSVQEYVPNSKTLFEALQELQTAKLTDDEIRARFDQDDFEDANLLLWLTYDTDGHLNNFLVYPKSVDAVGNEILGIKKIDNGLAFPDKNEELRNNLQFLPNADLPLSSRIRAKIAALSPESLQKTLRSYGLDSASQALVERLTVLKELAKQDTITIGTINQRMELLGQRNGTAKALS